MELVKVVNNEIVIADEVKEKMKLLHQEVTRLSDIEFQVREALLVAMREHNIKSIDNEIFTATYKAPTTRKSVDTKALKEQGLYDAFTKESPVKDSVALTYK